MKYDQQNLYIKCAFKFLKASEDYFGKPLKTGARLTTWNYKKENNTAVVAIVNNSSSQEDFFDVEFILLQPYNLDTFEVGSLLKFGAPGLAVGEGVILEIYGYWKGIIPAGARL